MSLFGSVTLNNCTFNATDQSITPAVSTSIGATFKTILAQGLYSSDVSSTLSSMSSETDMDVLINTFVSSLAPYGLFLEDMSSQITALGTSHSLSSLVDILNMMFFYTDMSTNINSLKNNYYQAASIVVSNQVNFLIDAYDNTVCGTSYYINAETDNSITVTTDIKFAPTNANGDVTTLSRNCSIIKNHQYHGEWKEGYNRVVNYLTKPTVKEITNKATSLNVDKGTWFLKNLTLYRIESSNLSTSQSANYTLTFSTKIYLVNSSAESVSDLDNIFRYRSNYTVDQLFDTEGVTTGNDLNSLATSLSNVDAKLDNVSTTTTLELTEASYYNTNWTYYSQDYVPTLNRCGNVIQFTGAFKNTATVAAISSSSGAVTMCTIPTEYRPPVPVRTLCQGSGLCHWLMTVNTDGTVTLQRYGYNNTAIQMDADRWLVFNATWIVSSA